MRRPATRTCRCSPRRSARWPQNGAVRPARFITPTMVPAWAAPPAESASSIGNMPLQHAQAGVSEKPRLNPGQDPAGERNKPMRQVWMRNLEPSPAPMPRGVRRIFHSAYPLGACRLLSPHAGLFGDGINQSPIAGARPHSNWRWCGLRTR
jgi:hypothetical protein